MTEADFNVKLEDEKKPVLTGKKRGRPPKAKGDPEGETVGKRAKPVEWTKEEELELLMIEYALVRKHMLEITSLATEHGVLSRRNKASISQRARQTCERRQRELLAQVDPDEGKKIIEQLRTI